MKKSVKGIIGLSAALVVLGGSLAVLKLTEPDDSPDESSVSDITEVSGAGVVLVQDKNSGDGYGTVSKVRVTNRNGEVNAVIQNQPNENSAAVYTLEDYTDVPLDTSVIGTLAYNANGLASSSIVAENCTETEKYGFDDPEASVEVTYESGNSVKFFIGDTAPKASETYVMVDGDDTVYTVDTSKIANYSKTLYDFVSNTIVEKPADDQYPVVNSLRIQRDDIDYDIYLEYDKKSDDDSYTGGTSATHVMMEPTFSYLTVEKSTPITNGIFGLTAKSIYSVHAGEAEIAQAGLKEPFCKVTMNYGKDGSEYVLLMSEPFTDENAQKLHYAMLEGGNVIYTVSAEDAQWGTIKPIDISSKIIFGTFIWNISDMTVKCSGQDLNFKVSPKDASKETSSLKSEDMNVTKNDSVFDAERYRSFYSFLVLASAEDFALGEEIPSGVPMASVEFRDSYTEETTKVEFYDYSSLNSLIVINGESKYFCGKSYVETLIENIKRIETGEEYLTTWK